MKLLSFFLLVLVSYICVFQLPYAVWTFPLTQNWFMQNGLVLFRDVIFHHTDLTLFLLFFSSKLFGNTFEMLQISSFILSIVFLYGIYITTKQVYQKGNVIILLLLIISFFPLFNNFQMEEMVASIFTLFGSYFFLKYLHTEKSHLLILSGILAGLGVMGKQAAVGIFLVFLVILVLKMVGKRKVLFRSILLLISGGLVGVFPILLYYFINQALDDFLYWNVIFNILVYPKQSQPKALGDGLLYGGWILLSVIPGILLLWKEKLKREIKFKIVFLILAIILLSVSLLPSFHEYKLLIFYPYGIILWSLLWIYRKNQYILLLLIVGLLAFLPVFKSFYIDYLPANLFHREYILEYGENELKVVDWIKKNTDKNERIMNLGHHYITTLSQRLPKNKYIYIFPWLVLPFDKSTEEILSDPPGVVIIDNQTLSDWPDLTKKWKFVPYVKKNYKKVATHGTYEIYTNSK